MHDEARAHRHRRPGNDRRLCKCGCLRVQQPHHRDCSSTEPPQPQGGTVEDGTYVLEAFTHYGGCPTAPEISNTTWSICGDHWDVAQVVPMNSENVDAGLLPILRLDFAATFQGASVSLALSCEPSNTSASSLAARGYTASSTSLTFIYPDPNTDGAIEVSHYARQ